MLKSQSQSRAHLPRRCRHWLQVRHRTPPESASAQKHTVILRTVSKHCTTHLKLAKQPDFADATYLVSQHTEAAYSANLSYRIFTPFLNLHKHTTTAHTQTHTRCNPTPHLVFEAKYLQEVEKQSQLHTMLAKI
jgi:hypothetical protein